MFLPPEKFVLLIAFASGIPIIFIVFISILLFKQNNMRKQQELDVMHAMLTTQEDERKRIASDLHDQIGPQLVGAKLLISFDSSSLSEKQSANLVTAKQKLDDTITEIRNVAHNLYSENIYEIGLVESLREEVRNLESTNKHFILNLNILDSTIPYLYQINIYRICLELISNSIKHSSGDTIFLSLSEVGDAFILDFNDNGTTLSMKNNAKGIGLQNIRNRIKLLGGEIIEFPNNFLQGAHFAFKFKIKP